MGAQRKHFTPEFKQAAVRRAASGDATVLDVARELGIRTDRLREWMAQAQGSSRRQRPAGGSSAVPLSLDEEVRQLRRENAQLREERDILKKGGGLLRPGVPVSARCAFIQAHQGEHPIRRLCQVLGVSRAGYYAWHRRQQQGPGPRATADGVLTQTIQQVHRASQACYGSPRIHAELRAAGVRCSRKRVARLMREQQLAGKRRRRFRVGTTDARHAEPVVPNHLDRQFRVAAIGAPDRVWAADYTFVPTRQGFLYLAVVLDLYSRRVVGWAMRHTQDHRLVLDALAMAVGQRQPRPGVVHHSDRGRQYASTVYQAELTRRGMCPSMSRVGDCWDNAVVESFFATLKTELVEGADWGTREEARQALFGYLEVWYNRQRRHSTLGYQSPVQFEQRQVIPA
ncbi:MAG TPA: IS3 family transposase [Gemmatimonadales bacterium]|nr:IS3 family transposase [Gemmatimonadales bacterium]HEX5094313.1 IS3 family transposase [Burkholderiales bacterium]